MKETLYWYDFETTGIDAGRDRAIQFAGIRTDYELNIVSEPLNLFCKPGNDTVPSPEAILVTGIGFDNLQKQGMNEADFSRLIHQEFSTPASCVTGYNSIRFDDEFTRYMLYRNFYDPYVREWQNGNSRWDVIDLFRMAHALRPEGIEWPKNESGDVSFRLEKLSEANGIAHEDAHDAVSDVVATIELTKKLRQAQTKLYDYLFSLRKKNEVVRQLYPLGKQAVVHVSSMYPAKQSCLAIVLPLCVHPSNNNGVICIDLSKDPSSLIELGPKELNRRLFTSHQQLAEGEERIPLKTIHINRCPAIAPLATLKGLSDRLSIDIEQCLQHQKRLQGAAGIVAKIQEAFLMSDFENSDDPDLMLYQGGFFSETDKAVMNQLRQASPESLGAYGAQFQDPRLPEMLFRYRARNYPEVLSQAEMQRWNEYRRLKFSGPDGPDSRLAEISSLRGSGRGAECLDQLESYLQSLKNEVQAG